MSNTKSQMTKHQIILTNETEVLVDGRIVTPERSIKNIMEICTTFAVGHSGYAAKQLALAILYHLYGPNFAKEHYLALTDRVISKTQKNSFFFSLDAGIFFIEQE